MRGIYLVFATIRESDYLLASDMITFEFTRLTAHLRAHFLRPSYIFVASHAIHGEVMWLERV